MFRKINWDSTPLDIFIHPEIPKMIMFQQIKE